MSQQQKKEEQVKKSVLFYSFLFCFKASHFILFFSLMVYMLLVLLCFATESIREENIFFLWCYFTRDIEGGVSGET